MHFSGNRIKGMRLTAKRRTGRKNAGTTMVELIVSFALLAIFLTAVTMVISNALITYYNEQRLMSMFSVADTVFSEIKNDIRTMQPSVYPTGGSGGSGAGGFIKLRGSSGESLPGANGTTVTGETIEFVKANRQDGLVLEQIDAKGCKDGAALIELKEDKINVLKKNVNETIPAGGLTARYFLRAPERTNGLKNYFMDQKRTDSDVPNNNTYTEVANNAQLVWDAEDRLPTELYQGLTVKTTFSVKPVETSGVGLVVSSVDIKVSLYKQDDLTTPVYEKEGAVPLQNVVCYNNEKTVYSEAVIP